MTTTHDITDEQIAERLAQITRASVEWVGAMPADADQWDGLADGCAPSVADVRHSLDRCDLHGESATDEVDMGIAHAIAVAIRLPSGGCVSLTFAD